MPERVFEKNHMKMIESIQNLEHAVLNQYSSLNAILSFARVNIPAINKQIRAGKLKISDKSRIIRKHLPKYVKDLIRKQNRTSIRVKRVKYYC